MITKQQAIDLGNGVMRSELHFNECKQIIGLRGGIKINQERWRVNGKCKTWKTRPDEFTLPIKYGFRECWYLTQDNAADFHLAIDCPLNNLPLTDTRV